MIACRVNKLVMLLQLRKVDVHILKILIFSIATQLIFRILREKLSNINISTFQYHDHKNSDCTIRWINNISNVSKCIDRCQFSMVSGILLTQSLWNFDLKNLLVLRSWYRSHILSVDWLMKEIYEECSLGTQPKYVQ